MKDTREIITGHIVYTLADAKADAHRVGGVKPHAMVRTADDARRAPDWSFGMYCGLIASQDARRARRSR